MKNYDLQQTKTHFDMDAAEYDNSGKYEVVRSRYHYVVDEVLRNQFQSWLDVGCGTGVLLALVGEQRKAAKLFGIDLSEEMIKIARAKLGDKADLRVSDSERLPFEDEKFDLITCTFSFHHYPNPTAVLTGMKRVLSPNGKLIIADAVMFTPLRQLRNAIAAFAKEEKFYPKREILALVRAAGLEVSKWSRMDWLAYLIVAKRPGASLTQGGCCPGSRTKAHEVHPRLQQAGQTDSLDVRRYHTPDLLRFRCYRPLGAGTATTIFKRTQLKCLSGLEST